MRAKDAETRLRVRAQPGASANRVMGFTGGVLHLKIAAPPVKGKANEELLRFLSGVLGVSRTNLTLLKGHTGRNKLLAVNGLDEEEIIALLSPWSS